MEYITELAISIALITLFIALFIIPAYITFSGRSFFEAVLLSWMLWIFFGFCLGPCPDGNDPIQGIVFIGCFFPAIMAGFGKYLRNIKESRKMINCVCSVQLQKIGTAIGNYADDHKGKYPPDIEAMPEA